MLFKQGKESYFFHLSLVLSLVPYFQVLTNVYFLFKVRDTISKPSKDNSLHNVIL